MLGPREPIKRDTVFMLTALATSEMSPDPNTQVGACIVSPHGEIVSTGFNHFPHGNYRLPWDRIGATPLDTKYPYVIHAEEDAILNASHSLLNHCLFVTMHPCAHCTKLVIKSGIQRIIYLTNPYADAWETQGARELCNHAQIVLIKFSPDMRMKEFISRIESHLA